METHIITLVITRHHVPKPILKWCRRGKITGMHNRLFVEYAVYFRIYFPLIDHTIPEVKRTHDQPEAPPGFPATTPATQYQQGYTSYCRPDGEERIGHIHGIEGNANVTEWFKPTNPVIIKCINEYMT